MRSKSAKLVSNSGSPQIGPHRAGPTKPAVLVLTPSIDFDRKLVSSTYTPGDKYSGIGSPPVNYPGTHKGRHYILGSMRGGDVVASLVDARYAPCELSWHPQCAPLPCLNYTEGR